MIRVEYCHPMIYLLFSWDDRDKLHGYYTNGRFSDFYPFDDLSEMFCKTDMLLKESKYFHEPPEKPSDDYLKRLPPLRCWKMFVIEILYQQNGDWQGYLRGITGCPQVIFKNREEAGQKIRSEMKFRRHL